MTTVGRGWKRHTEWYQPYSTFLSVYCHIRRHTRRRQIHRFHNNVTVTTENIAGFSTSSDPDSSPPHG